MTLLPKVKLKAAVNFPAQVLDGTGIDVAKSNGTYQFNLDFGDFAPPVTALADPAKQNALLWNSDTGQYALIPAATLIGTGVLPATAFPLVESGSGAVGSSVKYAREDHVHPAAGTGYSTPARSQTRLYSDFTRLYINAALEGVPNDGSANASTRLQEIVTWVQTNRPLGALIDCSNGVFRIDSNVTVTGDHIVIGGSGHGATGIFRRNHNSGPLFTFTAAGLGPIAQLNSGMQHAALQDIGTGFNGSGQRTGCMASYAASPYGLTFETAYRPVIDNIEFLNESLATFGMVDWRPTHLNLYFDRTYDAGRIGWLNEKAQLSGSNQGKGAEMWGVDILIKGGVMFGGTCLPAIDYGLNNAAGDGFYVSSFYAGLAKFANVRLIPVTSYPIWNCGLIGAFIDTGLGDGIQIIGTEPVKGFQFRGVVSAFDLGAASVGINITNPIDGGTLDVERLEGWTSAGIAVNNASAKNLSIQVHQAQAISTAIVVINACANAVIRPGLLNGVNAAGTAARATHGVYLGAGAVDAIISGGKIASCTNNVTIAAGATRSGVIGIDLRSTGFSTPLTNGGTGTNAKANLGAADI